MVYQIISERKIQNPQAIKSPYDALEYLKRYTNSKQEYFITITLDTAHYPLMARIISIGKTTKVGVCTSEIFYYAIKDLASAIIISHTHPSGIIVPSQDDLDITEQIIKIGKFIGIKVLDHIIMHKDNYFSFCQENVIDKNNDFVMPSSETITKWRKITTREKREINEKDTAIVYQHQG
jgi:DNA repair protein RadC